MRESSTSPTDELTPTALQEVHDHGELFRKKLFQVGGVLGGWGGARSGGRLRGRDRSCRDKGWLSRAGVGLVGGWVSSTGLNATGRAV